MVLLKDERTVFEEYLAEKKLKHSQQRDQILDVFLSVEKHLTLEELHRIVREKYPKIGYVTVYRTLKLLSESGLCKEVYFENGKTYYEHLYNHKHHDHLMCIKCGEILEVLDPRIEQIQEKLIKDHGYTPEGHSLELYGICGKCRRG